MSGEPADGDRSKWSADLVLLAVALIWGVNIPLMKVALAELHPYAFNALRLLFSVLLLGILAHRDSQTRSPRRAALPAWWYLALVALTGSLLYQLVFLFGLDRTTAANAALIVNTAPLWTAIIAWLWGLERLGGLGWAGLCIAFAGTAWVTAEGGSVDLEREFGGNLLVLGAALMWALYTVMTKPILGRVSPMWLAFWITAVSYPLHVLIALPHLDPLWNGAITAGTWSAIVFSGALSTGLAYAMWNYGVQKVGPSHTAAYQNVVPVVAVVLGWTALGESITLAQVCGGALIFGGLLVMRRARPRRA